MMKKITRKRVTSLLICACLIGGVLSGCGSKKDDKKTTDDKTTTSVDDTSSVDEEEAINAYIEANGPGIDPEEDINSDEPGDPDLDRAKYSNSKLVEYTKLSPNKTANRNHKIDTITIHCAAGQLSIETMGNVFSKGSSQASANYGVGHDGRIALYVEECDRSWSSSNRENDMRAVNIEVASDSYAPYKVNDKAYEATIKLVTDICKRNGIKKLVWSTDKNERVNHLNGANVTVHRDYANKQCPGDYLYDHMGDIVERVNKNLGAE